jgi:dTDP-4-dehydrorhamnose 3,5-epimerase
MNIQALDIDGCFVIEHDVFPDERGLFREWFKASEIAKLGIDFKIAQANFSVSTQGVIRGLHYSLAVNGQKKLITCVNGTVIDILVDIRTKSPTYLSQVSIELGHTTGRTIIIDSGVAHGFSVSSESAALAYLTSSEYSPKNEKSISPFDVELNINWQLPKGIQAITSKADFESISFDEAKNIDLLPKYSQAI